MARPTQYQKLSLQLDAENKKLKAKLAQTKTQMSKIKGEAGKMQKGFGQSFDSMGGKAGMLKQQFTGLLSSIGNIHPAVLGLGVVAGALGLAFKDLTAFTSTWEGSLTDAGRKLASVQTGFKTFMTLAAEQRGRALAEGGIFGWIGKGIEQLHGLTTGVTVAMVAVQMGIASVVNDAMLSWQQALLDTTVQTSKLKAETQELYNQFRNTALLPEERLKAIDIFKEKALNLFKLQRDNAQKEVDFLELQSKLTGNSFEDNLKIEQKKAEIADLERQYHKMLGRTIEFEVSIVNALEKQRKLKMPGEIEKKKLIGAIQDPEIPAKLEKIRLTTIQQDLDKSHADWMASMHETTITRQGEVIEGYTTMAQTIGSIANGIANASKNWAAMGAIVASGIAQMVPQIQDVVKATKALFLAKQAEAVSGAAAASQSVPFPGNLVAMAVSIGAVLASIAPFVGSFARGTKFIPRDGLIMAHRGEEIRNRGGVIRDNNGGGGQLVAVVSGSDLHFVLDRFLQTRATSL